MVGSSDSDSEDDKRVVRSAKDRRFDELRLTCEEMRVSGYTFDQDLHVLSDAVNLNDIAFLKTASFLTQILGLGKQSC